MAESETYTHGHHESVLAAHRWRTIANSAQYLAPHLEAGRSLLDVGCGPGTITAEFAERLSPGRVVGVDAAPDALAAAGELETTAEFVLGDAYELPFDEGSFDIVHTHQTLQHVHDPVAMLREMARVARGSSLLSSRRQPRCSPPRRSARGGAARGRSVRSTPASRPTPSRAGTRRRRSFEPSATPGAHGRQMSAASSR